VNFLRGEGRVRFEVGLDAAERRGLRISPRMLAVAQSVRPARL
jgi:YfiR/HmsC-like